MSLNIFNTIFFSSKNMVCLIYSDLILCHSVKFCGFSKKNYTFLLNLFQNILFFILYVIKNFYILFLLFANVSPNLAFHGMSIFKYIFAFKG